ncbi:ABC transporter ATP-binding protein [Streptomyces sp. H34-S4]|uniref:ABC transporter ATP-binding protein n=1 Tax=Streptomyces sp. H34-S4 TaxID=2996463 RepID=UPI002271A2F6|nr:ABC transporter ATP-binding protein [Streptomyces sp. H34-S4]MCY0934887.1 ABC transporter ATP-binding protein [Streptomyces sp. H34-S4]
MRQTRTRATEQAARQTANQTTRRATDEAPPAVRFLHTAKSFGPVRALAGLELDVRRGETVALLGRNGAGKSTAIGLLLGLDEPDAGSVRLFGESPERAVRAGRVGAMLQEGRAVPRLTVRELVTFVARTYPAPMSVAETLGLAGLTDLAGCRVERLSGGQAQRVRFAVALAGNPELLVLDEPSAALDVEARLAFWESMGAYARRGNTVLFSTHYLEEADAHADRIVILDRGRVVADDTGEGLRRAAGGSLVAFDLAGRPTGDLADLPGVIVVEVRGERARLRTRDPDATVLALARLDAVRGLEVTGPSLEDAFLALTAGSANTPERAR